MCLVIVGAGATVQAAEKIRILPLGDSITAGYTDNPDWNVSFHHGYRGQLYRLLSENGYEAEMVGESPEPFDGKYGLPKNIPSPNLKSICQDGHRGYGGKDINFITEHIEQWLKKDRPDVILLMIGTNNIYPETSPAKLPEIETKLTELVRIISAAAPDAHLIVAQIIPKATFLPLIVEYNEYIRDALVPKLKERGVKISTVDQYVNFLKDPNDLKSIDLSRFSNHINHPDPVGYDRMAKSWYREIESLRAPVEKMKTIPRK
jgi:lysophospholipase L1-like esterase